MKQHFSEGGDKINRNVRKMYENFAFCYQKPISSRFSSFLKCYFKPLQNLTMKYLVKILRWKVFHSAESIHLLHAQSKFMIMIGEERDAFNQASSRMVSMSRLRAYYSGCGYLQYRVWGKSWMRSGTLDYRLGSHQKYKDRYI